MEDYTDSVFITEQLSDENLSILQNKLTLNEDV